MSMSHPTGGLPTWADLQTRAPQGQDAPQNHDQERDVHMYGAEDGKPLWGNPASAATGEAGGSGAALGEVADAAAVAL